MPNTTSAKKAMRGSSRKRDVNLLRKKKLKQSIKEYKKAVDSNEKEAIEKTLKKLYSTSDKIAKSGYIKKNKASRIKSRLTKLLNKSTEK